MDDTSVPTTRSPKEAKARQDAINAQIRGLIKDLTSTWLSHAMITSHAQTTRELVDELERLAHFRKGDNAM